jgi:hypothetical protein
MQIECRLEGRAERLIRRCKSEAQPDSSAGELISVESWKLDSRVEPEGQLPVTVGKGSEGRAEQRAVRCKSGARSEA